MAVDKKLLDRLRVTDPKVALLAESSGHLGPWSSAEYEAVFPVAYPPRKPKPEPPENVRQLLAALDEKVIEYEAAKNAWVEAIHRARALRAGNRVLRIRGDGQPIYANSPSEIKAADQAIDGLAQDFQAAESALRIARAKHSTAYRNWDRSFSKDQGES